MILVILLFALFASLFGLSKASLEHCEPFFLVGSRMTFAGFLLLLHQWFYNRDVFKNLTPHTIRDLIIFGFISIYLTNIGEIWGLQHMSSAKACFIYSLTPFVAAFLSYWLFKEKLSTKKWVGMVLGFLGLIPLKLESLSTVNSGAGPEAHLGELALLVAVLASSYGWILLKSLMQQLDRSPLFANGFAMLFGGALALLHSYWAGEVWSPVPVTHMDSFLINSVIMCSVSNIICYNLYGYLLKRYSVTFMAFAGLVTPLFASFFGWLFLHESLNAYFGFSFILFASGLTLFYQEEIAKGELRLARENVGK